MSSFVGAYRQGRMWLPWEWAVGMAMVLGVVGWWPTNSPRPPWRLVAAEAAVVLVLYALWLRAGELDPLGTDGGLDLGRTVWDVERWFHLPREQWLQQGPLANRRVLQASNLYYAGAHVPAMGVFLVWMYFRHRDHYRAWRTTLALTTGICLVIRYLPVAPPRFYPELGFVDTALQFNQSVYGAPGAGVSAQFAAMPSIHVAWGVLIGVAAWRASSSRWRWIALVHAAATVYVVTSTANHWWLDGIVGAAFLAPAYWVTRRFADRAWRSVVVEAGVVGKDEVPPVETIATAVRHDVAGLPDAIFPRVAE